MGAQTITPQRFEQLRQENPSISLIDVRTPPEYRAIHAEPAQLRPLDQLDPREVMALRNGNGDAPIYFICKTGSRSAKACEKMQSAGFANAFSIDGGTEAWERAGLPVVRGKQTMSLERQVRISAGLLMLAGLALGWFLHPAFLLLSAFVGGGLMLAGLTDWCGMGMLLAKMPWNR